MRDKLVIVPCGKKKIWDDSITTGPVMAREAYTGTLFKLGIRYAYELDADLLILSAKYGYIDQHEYIEPYDVTFNNKSTNPIEHKVLSFQLTKRDIFQYKRIIGLGGAEYRRAIATSFEDLGRLEIETPFAGLRIGDYQRALKDAIKNEIINGVTSWYHSGSDEAVKYENEMISFPWKCWWVPSCATAFDGWLEGPGPTKIDREFEYLRANERRKMLLRYGPRSCAWQQHNAAAKLIGKRLFINMGDNIYGEEAYPVEASLSSLYLSCNDEGFLQCYLCLSDIVKRDTGRPEFCMYDNSYAFKDFNGGMKLLNISEIYEVSII